MRPIALSGLTLTLLLGGCGNTWWNPPLTGGYSPNAPVGDSVNMGRVMGQNPLPPALETEPGDIWPGPLPPSPTIGDIGNQAGIGAPGDQPNLATSIGAPMAHAMPKTGATVTQPRTADTANQPAAATGSSIVVPNGNGTSTVIHPDGRVETVTTPK